MLENKEKCRCWDDILICSYWYIINVIYFQETTDIKFHFKHQQNLRHSQDKILM